MIPRIRIGWLVVALLVVLAAYLLLHKTSTKDITQSVTPTNAVSQTPLPTSDLPAVSVFTTGLDIPWAIAFLPDGRLLVTQRKGTVVIIDSSGKLQSTAATIGVSIKPDTEGGLLGIVLNPHFKDNHYVYLYYTYATSSIKAQNRVVRMTFANDKLTDEKIIVDNIPSGLYHNGGRIKFGPDGYLYITTGDSQDPSLAQNTNSLAGKILRVTDDGKSAPGNPFNNLVYSYGHRNPQGIAWDSSGQLWETEHGPSGPPYGIGNDEVNRIDSGKNYGWPIIQGDQSKSGMITPVKNSTPLTTWAPSGMAFVKGTLFFSGLRGQRLYVADIQNNQIVNWKERLVMQYGRLREVILGPDGMIYVTTSNRDGRGSPKGDDDKILRINPGKI